MSNVVRIEDWFRMRDENGSEKPAEQPKQQGVEKVSIDDGFTAIPNGLLKAILRSKVLGWKGSYLLATILKTLSWHKESDWFTHSQVCEMMNIEPTKYHINQLSAARKELIKERVLFESGKKTGVNLDVFKWEMVNPEKVGSSRNNRDSVPEKVGSGNPEKVGNTKETITKEKINTPIIPQGENLPCGKSKSKTRRVGEKIDFDKIADLWNQENENYGGHLPFVEKINDERKRAIKKFLGELKEPTTECAEKYFRAFFGSIKPHHLGENERGWRANFDFAIKPKQVLRVREGAL